MGFEVAAMSFGYCEGEDPALAAPRKKENFFVFVVGTLHGIDIEVIKHRVEWYKTAYNDHQTIEVSEENGIVSFFIRSSKFYDLWFGERETTLLAWYDHNWSIAWRANSPILMTYVVACLTPAAMMYGISKLYEVGKNWHLRRAVEQHLNYLCQVIE